MVNKKKSFFAIDFDRCLSNTELLNTIFFETIEQFEQIQLDVLSVQQATIEARGDSFDPLQVLMSMLSDNEMERLIQLFIIACSKRDVLNDGAREILSLLGARGVPFGIVSYGNPAWQSTKIVASGLSTIPSLITSHKRKGEIIASWQEDNKKFLIPAELTDGVELVVEEVVLLDDKAIAFITIPSEARGYWVQPADGRLLSSQKGSVPANVKVALGLRQVIISESFE